MNVSKTIFIVLLSLLSAQFASGQAKDDGFSGQNDPVKAIQLFPNPTTEFLTIKFESPAARKSKFTVHNIIGNEIDLEPEIVDEFEVRIKVKELHEGYYFLAVQNIQSGFKSTHKFLKR
jgi:hypothetical protein